MITPVGFIIFPGDSVNVTVSMTSEAQQLLTQHYHSTGGNVHVDFVGDKLQILFCAVLPEVQEQHKDIEVEELLVRINDYLNQRPNNDTVFHRILYVEYTGKVTGTEEKAQSTASALQLPATLQSTETVLPAKAAAPGIAPSPIQHGKNAKAVADAAKKANALRRAEIMEAIRKAQASADTVAAEAVREANLKKRAEVLQSVAKTVPAGQLTVAAGAVPATPSTASAGPIPGAPSTVTAGPVSAAPPNASTAPLSSLLPLDMDFIVDTFLQNEEMLDQKMQGTEVSSSTRGRGRGRGGRGNISYVTSESGRGRGRTNTATTPKTTGKRNAARARNLLNLLLQCRLTKDGLHCPTSTFVMQHMSTELICWMRFYLSD
jgi:hypothetical protein